jgi:hypothetical protein
LLRKIIAHPLSQTIRSQIRDSTGFFGRLGIYALVTHPNLDAFLLKMKRESQPNPKQLIPLFQGYDFVEICELASDPRKLQEILQISEKDAKRQASFLGQIGFRRFYGMKLPKSFRFDIADDFFMSRSIMKISGTPEELVVVVEEALFTSPNFDTRIVRLLVLLRQYRLGIENIQTHMLQRTGDSQFFIDVSDGGFELLDEFRKPANLFTFTRRVEYTDVGLIPDPYTLLDLDGLTAVKMVAKEDAEKEYSSRVPKIYWRGSTTGVPMSDDLLRNERISFCVDGLDYPDQIDSKITRVVQMNHPRQVWWQLKRMGVFGRPVREAKFADFQSYIDLDGNSSAWGTLRKYLRIIHVIKFKSEFEMFYHVNQPSNTFTQIHNKEDFFSLLKHGSNLTTNFEAAWNGYLFALDVRRRIAEGTATVFPLPRSENQE